MEPIEKNQEQHAPESRNNYIYSSVVRAIIVIASLILEIVPTGVVMVYGVVGSSSEIEFLSRTYSFFNLTPFGYAIFCPFIIAVLTCVLILLTFVDIFTKKRGFLLASIVVSSIALALSLLNLFVSMTAIGWILISLFAIYLSIAVTELRLKKKADRPNI